ncbi:MAG: hypothetical protein V4702_01675 [Patescibacteria group bacterium]
MIKAQGSGLQVSPVKTSIDASPGDKKKVTITVRNVGSAPGKFSPIFDNFTAADDESGQPKITSDLSLSSGIKTWLSGLSSISLNAGASGDYTLNVAVPAETKPGTYYGTVRFSAGDSSASVGSLLFVNVGAITQEIAIEEFDTTSISVATLGLANGKFIVRLKNIGNGYTLPKVKIEILDDKKAVIETLDANKDLGGILPNGTIRKYTAELSKTVEPNRAYSARVTAITENNKPVIQEKNFIEAPVAAATQTTPPKTKKSGLLPIVAGGLLILLLGVAAAIMLRNRHKPDNIPSGLSMQQPQTPEVSNTPPTFSPSVDTPSPPADPDPDNDTITKFQ